nr:hypothetical protein CFP56_60584 [Quercus suber]
MLLRDPGPIEPTLLYWRHSMEEIHLSYLTYLQENNDADLKSDAESSCCLQEDFVYDSWEDEQSINELVCEEGTRKRLELLPGMVGVDNTKPEVVLAEVVRVLKDLERLNGFQLLK